MRSTEVRYFVDCPNCGPAQLGRHNGSAVYCVTTPDCRMIPLWGQKFVYDENAKFSRVENVRISKPRIIDVKLSGERSTRACSNVCTSGKRSCDCRCFGKCHGAGRCLGGHA